MAVPYTTAKSGQPYKSNSGIILKVSGANAPVGNLTEITNVSPRKDYGSILSFPVSTASSGNMGIVKPITGGAAGIRTKYVEAKGFIAMGLPTKVAGTQSNILTSSAGDFGQHYPVARFYSYQRLKIDSWSATGVATRSSASGNSVLASGINGVVGQAAERGAYISNAVPAQFVYITGPVNPTTVNQAARTNP